MRVRIENVTLVTTDEANRVFENGCLVWEDDTILALNDFSVPVDEVIDGQGGLLLPGMVNTHCHLGMIPFRSLGDDCPDRRGGFCFRWKRGDDARAGAGFGPLCSGGNDAGRRDDGVRHVLF